MTAYLDLHDLVEIARRVLSAQPKVRDYGLLASAAARPATTISGIEAYGDPWTKAAALLHSLCRNHALLDGNERLAWAAARVFLGLNGVPLVEVEVDRAEVLVLSVADGTLTEVTDIAADLRQLYRATLS